MPSLPKMHMHVRPATMADIPALADIGYEAFFNEPIDGHWFPFKEEYPHDYHRSFVEELSLRLVTPGNAIMLVELKNPSQNTDQKQESAVGSSKQTTDRNPDSRNTTTNKRKVVAYLVAIRHGLSESSSESLKDKWNPDTPLKKITRTFLTLPDSGSGSTSQSSSSSSSSTSALHMPNRAMSETTISSYYAQAARIYSQHMEPDMSANPSQSPKATGKGWIDCRFLTVHPAHQRQGAGEKLIEWIASTAAGEDVPVFLDTTEVALPLYLRYGARVIGRIGLPEQIVITSVDTVGENGTGPNRNGEEKKKKKKIEALEVKVMKWTREWASRELVTRARL